MYSKEESRVRVVSISELQFLICVKENLWGANNSHLNSWSVGDYIVFIVDKKIVGLAKVSGVPFKSDEIIWTNGKFPYKLPIRFEVVLHANDRIIVEGKVKQYLKNDWNNYGIPIRFKLLLPSNSGKKLINLILNQKNSIKHYHENINNIIKDNIHKSDNNNDESYLEEDEYQKKGLKLSSMTISNWRQFKEVDIQFHENLTILTGANGTGKTTLLNLINYHFGWEIEFVNTDIHREYFQDTENYIGNIAYSNGEVAQVKYPTLSTYAYKLKIENIQEIRGLYIPSHRSVFGFDEVESIPTRIKPLEQISNEYTELVKSDYTYKNNKDIKPNYLLKESLISLVMFGYGNEVIRRNIISLTLYEEFKQVLKQVLPPKFGFNDISIVLPNVILETESGSFPIEAVSGGIASIIDLSWQIFLQYKIKDKLVVTIDEPENHLHPEMQRRLMPSLIKAFPSIQFIVITHNPFIISSVKESNIYILKYDDQKKIESDKLDFVNKAGTSNDILREALGLPITMPIWVEDKLNALISTSLEKELTEELLLELRDEMENIGLEKYIPTTIANIFKRVNKND